MELLDAVARLVGVLLAGVAVGYVVGRVQVMWRRARHDRHIREALEVANDRKES